MEFAIAQAAAHSNMGQAIKRPYGFHVIRDNISHLRYSNPSRHSSPNMTAVLNACAIYMTLTSRAGISSVRYIFFAFLGRRLSKYAHLRYLYYIKKV